MKKEYLSPEFEFLKIQFTEDILSGPSVNTSEGSISNQEIEATEWDPFA